MRKLTNLARRVLPLFLIGSLLIVLTGAGFAPELNTPTQDALTVTRDLPDAVAPGQEFDVTVTFTSPDDLFLTIGLHDEAPTGWSVSVDETWCDPEPNFATIPDTTIAEYLWIGPYSAGQAFTALYKVQVPTDAAPGTYTFADGWLEYYIGLTGPFTANLTGDTQVVVQGAEIAGVTSEVNCDILPEVTITLYKDAVETGSTTSDGSGNYILPVPELGDYDVVASKTGYKDETQSITITEATYTLDFLGEQGLIPNAPNMSYVLACINHWLYPVPPCGLTMSKVLAVINAWLYPG